MSIEGKHNGQGLQKNHDGSFEERRFSFGKNWKNYACTISKKDVTIAEQSLQKALEGWNTNTRTFLDIGCGSGLFSLAARRLGFKKALSFDYDQDSVEVTTQLKNHWSANDDNWVVTHGSILDLDYMNRIGKFSMVYSWGVLHHTGDMWAALINAINAVEPEGRLYIAIYNDQGFISRYWHFIKQLYVGSSGFGKKIMIAIYTVYFALLGFVADVVRLRNPLRRYVTADHRGMKFFYDVVDWIGGYPFEVAKPEEIEDFVKKRGFTLLWSKTVGRRLGCNEYIFERHD